MTLNVVQRLILLTGSFVSLTSFALPPWIIGDHQFWGIHTIVGDQTTDMAHVDLARLAAYQGVILLSTLFALLMASLHDEIMIWAEGDAYVPPEPKLEVQPLNAPPAPVE